jgi:hypothetical protein
MKRDVQATEAKHFFSPKSYVDKQGREVLYGLDWRQRKGELWDRARGLCEEIVGWDDDTEENPGQFDIPVRCKSEGHDPHHVRPRSKGRDDSLANLKLLCRMHHELLDKRKPMWRKS